MTNKDIINSNKLQMNININFKKELKMEKNNFQKIRNANQGN